ncbi:hypothetical protein [Pseudomonas sp. UM16]|uniref:hypothetical protein n=1 Tax=Pseudomonas sp. UM16 TaxID=3158962 RepID=UPI00398FF6E2
MSDSKSIASGSTYLADDLTVPSLPDALPPLAGDSAFLIPVSNRTGALRANIDERWEGASQRQTVMFFWNRNQVHEQEVLDPDPGEFPMTFEIGGLHLSGGGIHQLYYEVVSVGGTSRSLAVQVDLDNTPPNFGLRPGALTFPSEIVNDGVTESYLADNQDQVIATLAHWSDIRLEDEIVYFLERAPGLASNRRLPAGSIVITQMHLDHPPLEVPFKGDDFRTLGNGNAVAHFYLRDRAGNEGLESSPSTVFKIVLTPQPQLLPPLVPLYDQHGLISEAVARLPVQVEIPALEHVATGDQILLHWGNVALPAITVPDPNANPLLRIPVSYRSIQGGGNGTLQVTYDLLRAATPIGRSPAKQVEVDITLPGGPDPDPESPWHGNLQLPTALGASAVPNIISPSDIEQPANVIIAWHGKDGQEVFESLDAVEAHWETIVLPYVITDADVIAKQPLRMEISSAQMKQAGTGRRALHYRVTRQLSAHPGYSNTAYSAEQEVSVSDSTGLPGGNDGLPAGDFPEKNPNNAINKEAAMDGTPYEIRLDYHNAAVGDRIDFTFRGHQGFADDPKVEPDRPIAGSYIEDTHEVTQHDLEQGSYSFIVGRKQLVAIKFASGNGYHWITNDVGTVQALHYHVLVDTGDLVP